MIFRSPHGLRRTRGISMVVNSVWSISGAMTIPALMARDPPRRVGDTLGRYRVGVRALGFRRKPDRQAPDARAASQSGPAHGPIATRPLGYQAAGLRASRSHRLTYYRQKAWWVNSTDEFAAISSRSILRHPIPKSATIRARPDPKHRASVPPPAVQDGSRSGDERWHQGGLTEPQAPGRTQQAIDGARKCERLRQPSGYRRIPLRLQPARDDQGTWGDEGGEMADVAHVQDIGGDQAHRHARPGFD